MTRKRLAAICGSVGLLAAGVFAAVAIAGVSTVSVCATATAASHTVAVDGTPVSTVGGDTATSCATTTYTTPTDTVTQTVTTTVTGPTTTVTTTAPATTTTTPPPCPVSCSTLKFSDEFNGAAGSLPSSTLWGAKSYQDNLGLCHWNGWNAVSENGNGDLAVTAQKDSTGAWQCGFISGKVGYAGSRYVEARAKVPCGYGTWASPVWEWGYPYGAAPAFEDDVSEQLGREPQSYNSTLHYWNSGTNPSSGKQIPTGLTLCNDFHTYGAAVYPDRVDFYFDGTYMASDYASALGLSDLTTWKDVANITMNVGGSWAGTPTISGPVSMLVDYVHVYATP